MELHPAPVGDLFPISVSIETCFIRLSPKFHIPSSSTSSASFLSLLLRPLESLCSSGPVASGSGFNCHRYPPSLPPGLSKRVSLDLIGPLVPSSPAPCPLTPPLRCADSLNVRFGLIQASFLIFLIRIIRPGFAPVVSHWIQFNGSARRRFSSGSDRISAHFRPGKK